jgi:DNA-binding MarR family transcriptional regulator
MSPSLSNLTGGEREVLEALKNLPRTEIVCRRCGHHSMRSLPYWGMSRDIANMINNSTSRVCQILDSLCSTGYVEKVGKGLYIVAESGYNEPAGGRNNVQTCPT